MSSRALRKLQQSNDMDVESDASFDQLPTLNRYGSKSFAAFANNLISNDVPCKSDKSDEDEEIIVKKRTKKKKKKKTKKTLNDAENVEMDFCVVDLPQTAQTSSEPSFLDILSINPKMMDSDAEMKRIFGTAISTVQQPNHKHIARGIFVTPRRNWPQVTRFGLDMEAAIDGLFTYTHNKEYMKTQLKFYTALESMDPNNISYVLAECPYHIDSLLQLSEHCMNSDNSKMGVDLLQRALHAFQVSVHPTFNIITGNCFLDYRRQENRGLFVALYRYIAYLSEKGCYRSSLEYCKVLLRLDIDNDPLAALLIIDFLAITSGEYDFLIDLYKCGKESKKLKYLPNMALSVPLAIHLKQRAQLHKSKKGNRSAKTEVEDEEANKLLKDALIFFPGFLTRLLKVMPISGVDNLDGSKLFGTHVLISEPDSLGRLLDLYVARTHHCWRESSVVSWLQECVSAVLLHVEKKRCPEQHLERQQEFNKVDGMDGPTMMEEYAKKRKTTFTKLPRNINRHLFLSNVNGAPAMIPPEMSNERIYSFDPFPPTDSVDIYNVKEEMQRRLAEHTRGGGILATWFASLLPSFAVERANIEADVRARDARVNNPPGAVGGNIGFQVFGPQLDEAALGDAAAAIDDIDLDANLMLMAEDESAYNAPQNMPQVEVGPNQGEPTNRRRDARINRRRQNRLPTSTQQVSSNESTSANRHAEPVTEENSPSTTDGLIVSTSIRENGNSGTSVSAVEPSDEVESTGLIENMTQRFESLFTGLLSTRDPTESNNSSDE